MTQQGMKFRIIYCRITNIVQYFERFDETFCTRNVWEKTTMVDKFFTKQHVFFRSIPELSTYGLNPVVPRNTVRIGFCASHANRALGVTCFWINWSIVITVNNVFFLFLTFSFQPLLSLSITFSFVILLPDPVLFGFS